MEAAGLPTDPYALNVTHGPDAEPRTPTSEIAGAIGLLADDFIGWGNCLTADGKLARGQATSLRAAALQLVLASTRPVRPGWAG